MPTELALSKRGQPCPCGSGKNFEVCCEPILTGAESAPDAERLMRARYTAHVVHDFRFLHESHKPTAGTPFAEVPAEELPKTEWTRLAVHAHEPGRDENQAFVDFSAYGKENGQEQVLHEKAEFVRTDGKWFYNREVRLGPAPVRAAQKVGRNDPCPCGSGKKYKHCCLGKA